MGFKIQVKRRNTGRHSNKNSGLIFMKFLAASGTVELEITLNLPIKRTTSRSKLKLFLQDVSTGISVQHFGNSIFPKIQQFNFPEILPSW